MSAAVTGRNDALGVLADQRDPGDRIAPALEHLRGIGLSAPSAELAGAIGVALSHRSHLHEHTADLPGVTAGLLDGLRGLGQTFVRRQAGVESYRRIPGASAGALSEAVSNIVSNLPGWTATQPWLLRSAALGQSLVGGQVPAKVPADLCRQLIAVLCLAGRLDVAADLLRDVMAMDGRDVSPAARDPKSFLDARFGMNGLTTTVEPQGADHNSGYRARVTDPRGRSGSGGAPGKKSALQAAYLDYLRRHMPEALLAAPKAPPTRTAPKMLTGIASAAGWPHTAQVRRLLQLFGLPHGTAGLVSQAFVHSSWAFEHRTELQAADQRDNTALAFVGSCVAMYEHALVSVRHVVAEPPAEYTFRNLDNDGYAVLFDRTGIGPGLLLGTGQAAVGISPEMAATAFQAMIGAVFVGTGYPRSLAQVWPAKWDAVLAEMVPAAPHDADPTTILEQHTNALRLRVEREYHVSGPDHATTYVTTTTLISDVLGAQTILQGPSATSKGRSKHDASGVILGVLDLLAEPDFPDRLRDSFADDRTLADFLLAHQAAVLVDTPVAATTWSRFRLFGTHLAASLERLTRWARNADAALRSPEPMGGSQPRLEELFRAVLERDFRSGEALDARLTEALHTIEQIARPTGVKPSHVNELIQLCNVYRCLGADDPGGDLGEAADEWRLLYRGRLLAAEMSGTVVDGRERAVLDAAVATVLGRKATAAVSLAHGDPVRILVRLVDGPRPHPAKVERVCELWSEVTPMVMLAPVHDGIEMTVTRAAPESAPGPILAAVLAATRPKAEPYRAGIADLLHDLKNQMTAARHAVADLSNDPVARLEQRLAGERHLTAAKVIALSVRAAASLLAPAPIDDGRTELGSYLRRYGTAAIGWLPADVALRVPPAGRAIDVAVDGRTLTAVLDNLMRNAVEALPGGGAISLDWTADRYEATIELHDNGPGLPPEVVQALDAGRRVRSTKPGGNGLGLLGVRSLLRRVGGRLTAVPTPAGTTWHITLPLAPTVTPEDP
ncbi:ATP-binding protein [Dactylosporangium sp. CA-233914]|uniref:ATP-binding protein n=1 Tax=Dactylosporangium sp. CA-233914 TaxID=3239934 RepID=UPI003D93F2AB